MTSVADVASERSKLVGVAPGDNLSFFFLSLSPPPPYHGRELYLELVRQLCLTDRVQSRRGLTSAELPACCDLSHPKNKRTEKNDLVTLSAK